MRTYVGALEIMTRGNVDSNPLLRQQVLDMIEHLGFVVAPNVGLERLILKVRAVHTEYVRFALQGWLTSREELMMIAAKLAENHQESHRHPMATEDVVRILYDYLIMPEVRRTQVQLTNAELGDIKDEIRDVVSTQPTKG